MLEKWITAQWNEIPMVLLSCLITYSLILVYTRITGLRSFSKMSASDFVMTLAVDTYARDRSDGARQSVFRAVAVGFSQAEIPLVQQTDR